MDDATVGAGTHAFQQVLTPDRVSELDVDWVEAEPVTGVKEPSLGVAARLGRLQPQHDSRAVAAALAATAETVRFLADNHVGLQAPPDLDEILAALAVEGRALEPSQLLGLATFRSSIESTAGAVRRAGSTFPILRNVVDVTSSFDAEIAGIRRKIDATGDVVDDASPELKSIRERLRKGRARLRGTLESYLRG